MTRFALFRLHKKLDGVALPYFPNFLYVQGIIIIIIKNRKRKYFNVNILPIKYAHVKALEKKKEGKEHRSHTKQTDKNKECTIKCLYSIDSTWAGRYM